MKKILLSSSFILAMFNLGAQTTYRLELIAEGNFGTPNGDVFVRNTTVTPATNSTGVYQATNATVGIDVLQDYAIAGNKAILIGKPSGAGKIIVASYPDLQNLHTFSGNAPQTIGVASNTKAYVSYGNPAAMVCIDLTNLTSTPVTGTISSYSNHMVGAGAFMFAQIAGNIVKIDTATNTVISTISPGVGAIKGVMKNNTGNKLWVMGANGLVSIDLLNADQVSTLVPMGISSIGTTRYCNEKIYFWSLATKKLYIYDIATGTVPTAEVYTSTLPGNSFSFCYGRSFDIDQTTGDFVVASANNYSAPSYFEVVDGSTFTVIESSTMPNCAIANKCVLKTFHTVASPPVPDIASLPTETDECSVTLTPPTADNGSITATTTDPVTYSVEGSYTVNWTYTNGNQTASQIQTVTIDDLTAPVVGTLNDATINCNTTLTAATAIDACAGTITGTTADPLTFASSGTYTVNWLFNDGRGNISTATQTVIVDCNSIVPDVNPLPAITAECSATLIPPTATSNNGTITATTTDATIYISQGTFTVTWTYIDGSLTNTQTQTVTIDDITAPATSNLANAALACNATLTAPMAPDNCAGTITATTTDPLSYNTSGTYTVTWIFNDGNGNSATENQQVVVTCSSAGISENEMNEITLYPNPANNSLNVEFTSPVSGDIVIIDTQGKIIKTQSVNGGQTLIDLAELTNGIYFLHFGESVRRFSVIH